MPESNTCPKCQFPLGPEDCCYICASMARSLELARMNRRRYAESMHRSDIDSLADSLYEAQDRGYRSPLSDP